MALSQLERDRELSVTNRAKKVVRAGHIVGPEDRRCIFLLSKSFPEPCGPIGLRCSPHPDINKTTSACLLPSFRWYSFSLLRKDSQAELT